MSTGKKKSPLIGILSSKVYEEDGKIVISGRCLTKLQGSGKAMDTDLIGIDVPVKEKAAEISFGSRYGRKLARGFRLNTFRIAVDWNEAMSFDIQNKLIVKYDGEHEGRILYSFYDLKKGKNRNSEVFVHDGIAVYFRQSKYNSLGITVRDANQYDFPEGQKRIEQAYRRAKQLKAEFKRAHGGDSAGQDIILMYEKNCARYEESASVLYERLIDAGYDNVFYVVNPDNPAIQNLEEKYRRNMLDKDSDKHLEYFFAADTFVATESTEHALQLRAASKLVMDKVKSPELKYVFLQHGVMYMVSLNSEMRTGFRNSSFKLHRTVVSSELEKKHFTDLADMKDEDLYVSGLAKFDRCYRNEGADKIIIMLTWRRWETNQARTDLEGTKYYRFIERIYNAVPDHLKDKVVILPHPLMADRFDRLGELGEHIMLADSYDLVFRDCDLLITDYSSIAYDAFYRGANVVFCWEELEECMEHYGEGSFLMLNRENAYGNVCMNEEEIRAAVEAKYGKPQAGEDVRRFRQIVEFHDGKNSDRIIEMMKADGIIK